MRPAFRGLFCCLFIVVLGTAGCQRVSQEKAWQLEHGELRILKIDGARGEQKVSVAASSDVPVSVYLLLEKDLKAVEEALQVEKPPANVLASKLKTKEAVVDAVVPAGSNYAVVVVNDGGKKADVKVKVTGK